MRLSILIPLYNKEDYVDRCLQSLLDQDLPSTDYEIVIVDDGSKDSGPEIVAKYTEAHENIILIRQENQGPSAARNNCLQASQGTFLYFMDADDYLASNVLQSLLQLCEENKVEVLEFDTKETTNDAPTDKQSKTLGKKPEVNVQDGLAYVAEHGFRNEAWRYFVHRNLLEKTGTKFIEGTLYEDAIFTASLFLKTERMAKVALDIHRYVVVANSIVTSRDRAHNLKFIKGMVFAIEHFGGLINGLNSSDPNYQSVVNKLRGRQQALVFALIVRTLKFRPIDFNELKAILEKLKTFGAYPIDSKIEGIGEGNSGKLYTLIFVPIFNNTFLLRLGMGLMRLIPGR